MHGPLTRPLPFPLSPLTVTLSHPPRSHAPTLALCFRLSPARCSPSLCILDLSGHTIGDACTKPLALALAAKHCRLTELNLHRCGLGAAAAYSLGSALQANSSLSTLKLSVNKMGTAAGEAFGQALAENTTLQTLALSGNCMLMFMFMFMCTAMVMFIFIFMCMCLVPPSSCGPDATGTCLTTASSLKGNALGPDGVTALAAGLEVNKSLRSLRLQNCGIHRDGADALGMALQKNSQLRQLSPARES